MRTALAAAVVVGMLLAALSTVGSPPPAAATGSGVRAVHLAWVDDPARSVTVVWVTDGPAPSEVRTRPEGATGWTTHTGGVRHTSAGATVHEVTAAGLPPGTGIDYQIRGPDGTWGPTRRTRTAPTGTAADPLEVVHVADTGIAGRPDGLATGTAAVLDRIAALDPHLILTGGDLGYLDTDPRFTTVTDGVDAWFAMAEPVASRAPLMPTWGNHEILLGEGRSIWASRMPTRPGYGGTMAHSLDVGGAHIVSVEAVGQVLEPGLVDWVDADLAAARAGGARWLVVFLHAPPLTDGTSHGPSTSVRTVLGPVLEAHGVDLLLASHDQSYERSRPLVGWADGPVAVPSAVTCVRRGAGTVMVKASPGGKLSSSTWQGSLFRSADPPAWTAVRSRATHTLTRLVVAGDRLTVEVHGIPGAVGGPGGTTGTPGIIDAFEIAPACPAEVSVDPPVVETVLTAGTTREVTVGLDGPPGTPVEVTAGVPWLAVAPATATLPASVTVTVDTAGLAVGTHVGAVTVTAGGLAPRRVPVVVTVEGDSGTTRLMVTADGDRDGAVPLAGATVSGSVGVFAAGTPAGTTEVRFFLDGVRHQRERRAPWDLSGTAADGTPGTLDTTLLDDGPHTVTAVVVAPDGTVTTAHGAFVVANRAPPDPPPDPPPAPDPVLAVSERPDRTDPVALDGATVTGVVHVFVDGAPASTGRVRFFLDDPDLTGSPVKVERRAPWDLAGTAGDGTARGYDTSTLAPGEHSLVAEVTDADGTVRIVTATFAVADPGGGPAPEPAGLWVSVNPDRSGSVPLDGAVLCGPVAVHVAPPEGITKVRFAVDGVFHRAENRAPFDLAGGTAAAAELYDVSTLGDGTHTVTAELTADDGSASTLEATFEVDCAP